jgi:hypothetical protein
MNIIFVILFLAALGVAILVLLKNKRLEDEVLRVNDWAQASMAEAQRSAEQRIAATQQAAEASVAQAQKSAEETISATQQAAEASVAQAQMLIDQQLAAIQQESEQIRQHYETELRKSQEAADALVAKTVKDFEPLRKYEGLRDAEAEVQRQLADALKEATSLRAEAQSLMDQARIAAADERGQAVQKAKALRDQADALLNQATRDAGRIMAEAEKRAEQIGGDAYRALREKEMLEKAAEAMRNTIEGYGDRYLIPTHSLLDDLAVEFGYASAGAALKSGLDLSRRMVEQGEAAACDYVEPERRRTAIQFVIHAFNGDVASILAGVKSDNYGTLAQQIRDAFGTVNKDGGAFRNARILPAYLDARLAELKWAVVVQEMARQRQEEQRALREEMRDAEIAKREQEEKMHEAEKLEELKKLAAEENKRELEEAKRQLAAAAAEDKVRCEQKVSELEQRYQGACEDLAVASEQKLQISQITKKGRVYILSNEGSFGPGVYKIGETQRDAKERVYELSGASVPFEFDIHAVITTEASRALEHKLHRRFIERRVNKRNPRKEYFRVSLKEIRQEVEKLNAEEDYSGKIQWTEEAAATQWRESQKIDSDPQELERWRRIELAKANRSKEYDNITSFDEP